MKRISIDGGKTYTTPENAIAHVPFERIIASADETIMNQANSATPGGSIFDLLHKYLELAKTDLIIK